MPLSSIAGAIALSLFISPIAPMAINEMANGGALSCGTARYVYTVSNTTAGPVSHRLVRSGVAYSNTFINTSTQTRAWTAYHRVIDSWGVATHGDTRIISASAQCML